MKLDCHIIAGNQSAIHAKRQTLTVRDLDHVEGILQTRTGRSDSRVSTRANKETEDAAQDHMSSQGSTTGVRGRGPLNRTRGGRIGGRTARAWRSANRSEWEGTGNARSPIALSGNDADEQLQREASREL